MQARVQPCSKVAQRTTLQNNNNRRVLPMTTPAPPQIKTLPKEGADYRLSALTLAVQHYGMANVNATAKPAAVGTVLSTADVFMRYIDTGVRSSGVQGS